MRLAVYSDQAYRVHGRELWAEEAFALFLGRLSDAVDHLVVVGRQDPGSGPWHHRLPDGVELAALPHYESLADPRTGLAAGPRSIAAFWRALDGVDAVWLLGPHPLAIAFAAVAALRRRRVVLGVRQHLPDYVRTRRPGRRGLLVAALALEGLWRALARVAPVVVVGPDLARRYRRGRAVLDIPISLVDEADLASVDLSAAPASEDERVALSVGRLDPEKNPLLLADVLAALRAEDPRWRLVVCGDGVLAGALADRLAELGVADHADLRGYVPLDGGLRDLYRTSDAFLHVSWTEGFPQVLLEAFATGLPVVATDVGGVAELAGDAARLVPAGDAGAAAAELVRIADDREERRRLVRAGVARAERYTSGAVCRRLAAFVAGERQPAPQPLHAT